MSRRVQQGQYISFDTYMANREANRALSQRNMQMIIKHKYLLTVLILLCMITFSAICAYRGGADAKAASKLSFSVSSIEIRGEDTLWSIAKANYNPEYGTFHEYLDAIKECNGLKTDTIHAGSSLLVPIYTTGE